MTFWHDITKKPTPLHEPVLVAYEEDGRLLVTVAERNDIGDRLWFTGAGWGGYEWEFDFEAEQVRFWAELPAPPEVD